jgi:hypothetical protein
LIKKILNKITQDTIFPASEEKPSSKVKVTDSNCMPKTLIPKTSLKYTQKENQKVTRQIEKMFQAQETFK